MKTLRNAVFVSFLALAFSLFCPSSGNTQQVYDSKVGGIVWSDINDDGIRDSGEPGIAGVQINLYHADNSGQVGQLWAVGQSFIGNANFPKGYYEFDGLGPGGAYLKVILPIGYKLSPAFAGDPAYDSDFNPVTGLSNLITITSYDESQLSFDAGLNSVPEPLTMLLLGFSVIGVAGIRRELRT